MVRGNVPYSDYTGYDFWLRKPNQFGGNFINDEMVKAFIRSTRYRQSAAVKTESDGTAPVKNLTGGLNRFSD